MMIKNSIFILCFYLFLSSDLKEVCATNSTVVGCNSQNCTLQRNLLQNKWPIFQLYTKTNRNNFVVLSESNFKSTPQFNINSKTYLIVHGFSSSSVSDWVLQIKNNLLAAESANINVIAVDWKEAVKDLLDFFLILENVPKCGYIIGDFIKKVGIKAANTHCIGHSLGAHVCGYAGKTIKLGRISGLDPASALFANQPASKRLDKSDANFVDVIHVSDSFGIQEPIGHQNFYPNGGKTQPGCFFKRDLQKEKNSTLRGDFLSCSHSRATILFAESIIRSCQFTSVKCNNYEDFQNKKCKCITNSCTGMGFRASTNGGEGKFYLSTYNSAPYCIN